MSFYNPYMSHPDYGQGVNDFINQLFQMMMYKKYMDSMGDTEGQNRFPREGEGPSDYGKIGMHNDLQSIMQPAQTFSPPGPSPYAQPAAQAAAAPQSMLPQISPEVLQMMQQMFQQQGALDWNSMPPKPQGIANPNWYPGRR